MIFKLGRVRSGQAMHYGASEKPESVTCGNWSPSSDPRLQWTDEKEKVTCQSCIKRHFAAPKPE